MTKKTLFILTAAAIVMMGAGCAKQDANNQTNTADNTATTVAEFNGKYENSKYGFSLDFPKNWGEIKEEVKNGNMGTEINYQKILLTSIADSQRYITIQVLKNDDVDAPFVKDSPQTLITSDSIYSYYYSGAGDNAGKPGMEDQKYFDIAKEVKEISTTFAFTENIKTVPTTATTDPVSDLRVLIAAETDESWETYTSKTLGYSIMTPLKGKYAPMWEMKIVNPDDSHMNEGCYYPFEVLNGEVNTQGFNSSKVETQDKVTFCHTSGRSDSKGRSDILDSYATIIGTHVAVTQFTKTIYVPDWYNVDCTGKMTEQYSTSEKYCVPFIESEYQAVLDGIVGTFKFNQKMNQMVQ